MSNEDDRTDAQKECKPYMTDGIWPTITPAFVKRQIERMPDGGVAFKSMVIKGVELRDSTVPPIRHRT